MKKIIYILGPSRSGSSVLENYLHDNGHGIAHGEIRWYFKRGIIDDEKCCCGKYFNKCSFWKKTIDDKVDPIFADKLRSKFDNPVYLAFGYFFKTKDFIEYTKIISNLYEKLFLKSGIIIDNSKSPLYLFILNIIFSNRNISIISLHLNRDIYGLIDSYSKHKRRTESKTEKYMTKKSPTKTILYWVVINILSSIIGRKADFYTYLKYSDFCKNPKLSTLQISEPNIIFGDNHSLSGNPDRFGGLKNVSERNVEKKHRWFMARFLNYLFY